MFESGWPYITIVIAGAVLEGPAIGMIVRFSVGALIGNNGENQSGEEAEHVF